jgi:hypothetical protein
MPVLREKESGYSLSLVPRPLGLGQGTRLQVIDPSLSLVYNGLD